MVPGLIHAFRFAADGGAEELPVTRPIGFDALRARGPGCTSTLPTSDRRSGFRRRRRSPSARARSSSPRPITSSSTPSAACVYGVFCDLVREFDGKMDDVGYLAFAITEKLVVTGRRHPLQGVEAVRDALARGARVASPAALIEAAGRADRARHRYGSWRTSRPNSTRWRISSSSAISATSAAASGACGACACGCTASSAAFVRRSIAFPLRTRQPIAADRDRAAGAASRCARSGGRRGAGSRAPAAGRDRRAPLGRKRAAPQHALHPDRGVPAGDAGHGRVRDEYQRHAVRARIVRHRSGRWSLSAWPPLSPTSCFAAGASSSGRGGLRRHPGRPAVDPVVALEEDLLAGEAKREVPRQRLSRRRGDRFRRCVRTPPPCASRAAYAAPRSGEGRRECRLRRAARRQGPPHPRSPSRRLARGRGASRAPRRRAAPAAPRVHAASAADRVHGELLPVERHRQKPSRLGRPAGEMAREVAALAGGAPARAVQTAPSRSRRCSPPRPA